jgi:hypothetical protein
MASFRLCEPNELPVQSVTKNLFKEIGGIEDHTYFSVKLFKYIF